MADTPPPMASHTCPRSLGEIARNMLPRPNMDNARTIMTIPLSASARRTAAATVLNWYLSRGFTAGWKRIGEFAGCGIARPPTPVWHRNARLRVLGSGLLAGAALEPTLTLG